MNKKLLYVCYRSLMIQASANNLAPLLFVVFISRYHIGFEEAGRLALVNFLVQILADIFAIYFAGKLGYKKLLIIGHLFSLLAL